MRYHSQGSLLFDELKKIRKRKYSKIPAVPVDTNNPNPVIRNAMESEVKKEGQKEKPKPVKKILEKIEGEGDDFVTKEDVEVTAEIHHKSKSDSDEITVVSDTNSSVVITKGSEKEATLAISGEKEPQREERESRSEIEVIAMSKFVPETGSKLTIRRSELPVRQEDIQSDDEIPSSQPPYEETKSKHRLRLKSRIDSQKVKKVESSSLHMNRKS